MVTDPRQIRRVGSGFSQVDSVFHNNYTAGCVHGVRARLIFFLRKTESTWENPDPKRRISRKTTVKYPEYLPRLTTIEADRPGDWFPGSLDPYLTSFPAISLSRDFKLAKVPGNPMKSPFCFGVFWGHIKKKLFPQVDSRIP